MAAWQTRLLQSSFVALSIGLAQQAAAQVSDATGPATTDQDSASAQGVGTPEASSATEQGRGDDIVVTARQRQERFIDVPVAVAAVGSEQLQRYSLTTLSSIANQVPQLQIAEGQTAAGGDIVLRGLGGGNNPGGDQPTSLNIDGIQFSRAGPLRLGQLDLNRVEVLKGPQALFFGKNSPAGVISLLSNDPGPELQVLVRTGYEFQNRQRFIEPIVNVPIAEGFGARFAGYVSEQDGWFRNLSFGRPIVGATPATTSPGSSQPTSADQREAFGRLTLTYETPGGGFRAKWKTGYGQTRRKSGHGGYSQYYFCPVPSLLNQATVNCKLDRFYFEPDMRAADAAVRPQDFNGGKPSLSSEQLVTSLTLDAALTDWLDLTSVSGYFRLKEDAVNVLNGAIPNLITRGLADSKQFTQETRLQSNSDGPINFLLGAYYQDALFRAYQPTLFFPTFLPVNDYDLRTTAASGFGQLRYKLSDKLELSAGGRYSYEKKGLTGTRTPNGGVPTAIIVARPKRSFHDFSPEVTLTYKPNDSLTAYASYREGFTSGGYNTLGSTSPSVQVDLSYDQVNARGGEVGLKGYLADRQVRFDLTGYRYKYDGLQLVALRFDNNIIQSITVNAGSATIQGIELNAFFAPRSLRGFDLHGSISYNRARYTDFIGACYPGQGVDEGCNLTPRLGTGSGVAAPGTAANPYLQQNQNGKAVFRSPDWTATAGFGYDTALSGTLGGTISINGKYTSSFLTDVGNDPNGKMAKVIYLDASASIYGGNDRGWELSLIGRNLTQKFRVLSTIAAEPVGTGTTAFSTANLYGAANQPRTIMLQLRLKSSLLGQ